MKFFVAGGTGAIGRPLIGMLLARGHAVVALSSNFTYSKTWTSKELPCAMVSSMVRFNPDGDVARQVRQQEFPIVGNGEGVWSWLHIEDAALATATAAEHGHPGIYIIANDQPLKVREWLPAFARWVNAPPPPQIAAEDAGGADAVYYGTQMRGASNAKAKRELNFKPRPLEWIINTAAQAS